MIFTGIIIISFEKTIQPPHISFRSRSALIVTNASFPVFVFSCRPKCGSVILDSKGRCDPSRVLSVCVSAQSVLRGFAWTRAGIVRVAPRDSLGARGSGIGGAPDRRRQSHFFSACPRGLDSGGRSTRDSQEVAPRQFYRVREPRDRSAQL